MALQDYMFSTLFDADQTLSIPDWQTALVELSPLIQRMCMEQHISGTGPYGQISHGEYGPHRNIVYSPNSRTSLDRSGLDCILYQFLEPYLSREECDGDADRRPGETDKRRNGKIWSETACLPSGFTMKNVDDVEVSADGVTIKLVRRLSKGLAGIHTLTAVRRIELPSGVRPTTVKITWLGNTTLRVSADLDENIKQVITVNQVGEPKKTSTCQRRPDVPESSANPCLFPDERECHQKEKEIEAEQQQVNTKERSDEITCTLNLDVDSEPENRQKALRSVDLHSDTTSNLTRGGDADQHPKTLENCIKPGEKQAENDIADTEVGLTEEPSHIPEAFESTVNIEPFEAEEVKVRLSGSELYIGAVHKDEDEGNTSSIEMHRSISIPGGVNLDQVRCHMTEGGKLIISAPYSTHGI